MNVEGFLASLAVQTTSSETMRAYRQTLVRFEAFLHEKKLRVTQVKRSTVTEFINYLSEHKGRTAGAALAPATVARQLAILASYYGYLGDNSDGKIRNPVDWVKRPKVSNDVPRAVDDQTLATLIEGMADVRDKAMILTFIYSGLRLSELRQLNKDSITPRKRTSPEGKVAYYGYGEVVGKGSKRRDFRVGPKVLAALGKYIRTYRRMDDNNPALFLSSRGTRISCRAIQQIADKWCKRLSLEHVNVHRLRHSFATRNVNAGMSLSVLQSLLGHANPDTTGRYFRIRSERKTREYFAVMEFIRQTAPV
jgi:site-specific recombinase XerC